MLQDVGNKAPLVQCFDCPYPIPLSTHYQIVLAYLQFAVAVAKMHSITLTITPHLTIGALVGLHPFSVAVNLELVLPNVPEAVAVDVALMVVAAYAEAARDRAIGQHRGDVDARAARVIMVAHFALVLAEEAVAAVVGAYLALQACCLDELHHLNELFITEFEVGLVDGTPKGKHREQTPAADAQGNKEVAELRQILDGALVDTSDDIPSEARMLFHGLHSAQHILVAHRIASHPVVIFLEAIKADRDGFQACRNKFVEFFCREQHTVAHHTPHEAAFRDFLAAMRQIGAHGRLTACGDDHYLRWVLMGTHLIKHLEKVFKGYIVFFGKHSAVGAAMPTVEVAAQGAFPKQLVQLMLINALLQHRMVEFKHHALMETEALAHDFDCNTKWLGPRRTV